MSLLSLCVCKACRKWETSVSTIGRQEKEAGKTNFAQAWQKGIAKCSQFVIHNWLRAFRRQRKKVVFSCKVCALSDSTSSLKTQRESDCRIARMSFSECAKTLAPSAVHFACVCVPFFFFFFAQLHLHKQLIQKFCFSSPNTLLNQFILAVVLQLSCVHAE